MRQAAEAPRAVSRHSSVRAVQRPKLRGAASVCAMETASDTAANAVAHTAGSPLIDVVLPCLNEAGALPWLLTRMPAGYRPIVADNGSTDGSADIAASYGATVVHVPQRGFGAACHAGLFAATSDIVCIMDADGSFDPADLGIVADPVRGGAVDLMLGRRAPRKIS